MTNSSLYVSNLPYTFDKGQFQALFEQYGPVERVDIPDQHGSSKTIAYVHFFDEESATKAREALEGYSFEGRSLSVQYSNKKKKAHQPIQRNMSDSGSNDAYSRKQYNDSVVRPQMPMGPPGTLNFWDSEQYMSVPCKMIPVNTNTASMVPAAGGSPLYLTLPQFSKDGQTFGMATSIMSGGQLMDALVFLLPLSKKQPQQMTYAPPPPPQFNFQYPQNPPQPGYAYNQPIPPAPYPAQPQHQVPTYTQPAPSPSTPAEQSPTQSAQSTTANAGSTGSTTTQLTSGGNPIPSWLLTE